MKFLTLSVIASFLVCLIFGTVCIVLGVLGYEVSDTLIRCFFSVFGLEFGAAAAIKISKHQIKKQEVKFGIENMKENNLEITKDDVKIKNTNEFDSYDGYDSYDGSAFG